jgi:uncharacterized protein (UPF0262 family)
VSPDGPKRPGATSRGGSARIVELHIDSASIVRWSPEIEHERRVAVFDLLEDNLFELKSGPPGPYRVVLSLRNANLMFDVTSAEEGRPASFGLPLRPFRRVIKDYFVVCDSYFQAIKTASPSRIEAIDMGRRGLHDEGAGMLLDALSAHVRTDPDTARRLFTLLCVLHVRG